MPPKRLTLQERLAKVPKHRAPKGTGSVYPVGGPSGAILRYRGEITLDGRLHKLSAKTEPLAWAKIEALKAGQDPATATVPPETIESWMRAYLPKERATLRPKTLFGYERSAELHIYPELGNIPLTELTRTQVRGLVERMREVGLSNSRIHNTLTPLRKALQEAFLQDKVRINPAQEIKVGDSGNRFLVAGGWSDARIKAILDAFWGHPLYDVYALLLYLGCRVGELLALDWSSVRLREREVDLHRTTSMDWDEDGQGLHASFDEPKTKAGKRTVALPDEAVRLLWRRYHRMGSPKGGLVFPSVRDPARPMPHAWVLKLWHEGQAKAGLPDLDLHSLRHIAISRAIAANVDYAVVAQRAGHKTAAVTLSLYTHASNERAKAAAETANVFGTNSMPPDKPGSAMPVRTKHHQIPGATDEHNRPERSSRITDHSAKTDQEGQI